MGAKNFVVNRGVSCFIRGVSCFIRGVSCFIRGVSCFIRCILSCFIRCNPVFQSWSSRRERVNILSSESEKATDFHSWPNNNIRGCIYAGARGDWTTHQYTLNLSKASNVCVMISHLAQTKVFAVDFHLLNLLLKIVLALLLLPF